MPSVLLALTYKEKGSHLKHIDDKGDYILMDDNFNITGTIG